jgi:hypothetical protein
MVAPSAALSAPGKTEGKAAWNFPRSETVY